MRWFGHIGALGHAERGRDCKGPGTGNLSKSTSNGGAGVRDLKPGQCPRPLPQAGHMPPASSLAFRTGCLPTPILTAKPLHESATFCSVLVLRLSPFVSRRNCRSSSVSPESASAPPQLPALPERFSFALQMSVILYLLSPLGLFGSY